VWLSATFRAINLPCVTHSQIVTEEIASIGQTLMFQLSGTCFEMYMRNLVQHDVLVSLSTDFRDVSG